MQLFTYSHDKMQLQWQRAGTVFVKYILLADVNGCPSAPSPTPTVTVAWDLLKWRMCATNICHRGGAHTFGMGNICCKRKLRTSESLNKKSLWHIFSVGRDVKFTEMLRRLFPQKAHHRCWFFSQVHANSIFNLLQSESQTRIFFLIYIWYNMVSNICIELVFLYFEVSGSASISRSYFYLSQRNISNSRIKISSQYTKLKIFSPA